MQRLVVRAQQLDPALEAIGGVEVDPAEAVVPGGGDALELLLAGLPIGGGEARAELLAQEDGQHGDAGQHE